MIELPPPLYGEQLVNRLSQKIIHYPIADSLLYKEASLMLSSQPGIGKSILTTQVALDLANGMPIFGALSVPSPVKVWYIQMERPDTEALVRIQDMTQHNDLAHSELTKQNFYLDVELQALNFLNDSHLSVILNRGELINPDVIIIDPLYGVSPGLSKDVVGSNIAKVFTMLKKRLCCALWINHHTTKLTYELVGGHKVEKDDPFYGAQWLKAHVTASYYAKRSDKGVVLQCKKDSHNNLLKTLDLAYDNDTCISTLESTKLSYAQRYKNYINSLYNANKKSFTFYEAMDSLGCADTTLRDLNRTPLFKDSLISVKRSGHKTLYKLKGPIL